MKPLATGKTFVKPTARGVRVWIEGGKPGQAGFKWKLRYTRTIENGVITLTIDKDGPLKVAGRMRGDKELSIIDISASELPGFKVGQELVVEYFKNRIVIK